MSRPFKSELVIEENISEATFRAYHVGFEENKFRLKPLVDVLVRVIPEFAYGCHEGECLSLNDAWDKLRDAARLIYTTDKYGPYDPYKSIQLTYYLEIISCLICILYSFLLRL